MTSSNTTPPAGRKRLAERLLGAIEKAGNMLPDPAVIFVIAMFLVWILSALLDGHTFSLPSKDGAKTQQVVSQLSAQALTTFFSTMVQIFTGFHPLGVVLVALLGVGVAEASGFINAGLKALLSITPRMLLTPMLILVAIISHTAADAGYVLVIPLGAVIFYAAGRHPVAGIAAAFAGVSGGFSANFIPSSLDPLLAGLTQEAAQLLDPSREVNPLSNWFFMGTSSLLIIGIGWFLTDRVVEPRLRASAEIDGDPADMPRVDPMTAPERRGLIAGIAAMLVGLVALALMAAPADSPLRAPDGDLTAARAPLMQMIVPLIFILFLLPGVVHGFVAGVFKTHRDVIKGMSKTLSTMGYYIVMAFFASLFIYSFGASQMGALLAVEGATLLRALSLPGPVTLFGIIILCTTVNLLIGSSSAKWALLAPILVPMLMQLGLSPELTQAAYRIGDSSTNIITPLMPYFPLVVAFSQRYVKKTGIGTLAAAMLPYSMSFLVLWSALLMIFWTLGIPLGVQSVYSYP